MPAGGSAAPTVVDMEPGRISNLLFPVRGSSLLFGVVVNGAYSIRSLPTGPGNSATTLVASTQNAGSFIATANTVYFVLSATGIGAILLASYDLFFAIKWLGAAYLVWLGVSAFIGKSKTLSVRRGAASPAPGRRLFFNGFILQMSNPKALLFFTALLPQFIDPKWAIVPQVAILAVTSVVIEFVVQLFYAVLAGRAVLLASQPRYARIAERISGSLLISAGIGMAALRRA
jgi:threonine/homoserine/homoserine lactone efflux protein